MNKINWKINDYCNFNCHYCHQHDRVIPTAVTAEDMLRFLSARSGKWEIEITGGEPFLVPHFVDLCKQLTQEHTITVLTNLSNHLEVTKFAQIIDPSQVVELNIGVHIEERERTGDLSQFLQSAKLLQERGFNCFFNYVLHPTLLKRYQSDKHFFAEHGITITPRAFKGVDNNKRYPKGYSNEALIILKESLPSTENWKKLTYNFKGMNCPAGRQFFHLDPDGSLYRCPSDRKKLGTIFNPEKILEVPLACQVELCRCIGIYLIEFKDQSAIFLNGIRHYIEQNYHAAAEQFEKISDHLPAAHNYELSLLQLEKRPSDELGLSTDFSTFVQLTSQDK